MCAHRICLSTELIWVLTSLDSLKASLCVQRIYVCKDRLPCTPPWQVVSHLQKILAVSTLLPRQRHFTNRASATSRGKTLEVPSHVTSSPDALWKAKGKHKLIRLELFEEHAAKKVILAPPPLVSAMVPPIVVDPILAIIQKSKKVLFTFKRNQLRLKKKSKTMQAKSRLHEDPFHVLLDSQADEVDLDKPLVEL